MPKLKFTDASIRALTTSKITDYFDEHESGLLLRVYPTGTKSFQYRYHFDGKQKRLKIGRFPKDYSLSQAREITSEWKSEIKKGIDPQLKQEVESEELKQRKRELRRLKEEAENVFTFNDLVNSFKIHHLTKLKPRTQKEYLRIIENYLVEPFGRLEAEKITRTQIRVLLDDIAKKAPIMANRVKAVLSSVFSSGLEVDLVPLNPVIGMKKPSKERSKERFYTENEIRLLWNEFDNQAEPVRSVFKMFLMLGQRKSETLSTKWENIDLEKAIWIIPAKDTKADRKHIIPLPELTVSVLRELYPLTKESTYVFESPRFSKMPVKWLENAKERIRESTGISDFTIHDLRRTVATYMAQMGTNRTVLGKVLNHKELAQDFHVTARYDRHGYTAEMKIALNQWSDKLLEIVTGEKRTSNIIKLG